MTKEQILKEIGQNIKKMRQEKNVLQQDLAAICNFEVSNMSKIEAGRTNITIGTLNKIANALNISARQLLP